MKFETLNLSLILHIYFCKYLMKRKKRKKKKEKGKDVYVWRFSFSVWVWSVRNEVGVELSWGKVWYGKVRGSWFGKVYMVRKLEGRIGRLMLMLMLK